MEELLKTAADSLSSSNLPTTASILRIGKTEFVDDALCPTAEMQFDPRTAQATIRLGHKFVSEHADTPLRLATLLTHELLHHLLHHYVLYPEGRIPNIAQDMLINGLICRLAPSFQQLFNDVYSKNSFPQMGLRPGANLKRIANEEIREDLRSVYKVLYRKTNRWQLNQYAQNPGADPDTLTVEDLISLLERLAKKQEKIQADNLANQRDEMHGLDGLDKDWWKSEHDLRLLGTHNEDGGDQFDASQLEEDHQNDFKELLDNMIGDLSANPNAAGLFKRSFKVGMEQAPDELLEAMEASMREDIMKTRQIVEEVIGPRPALRTVVPKHLSRKEVLLLSQGVFPLFYPAFGPNEKAISDVIIYIDVSGSMGDQAPFLLMLLTAFKNHVSTEFYQFSTEIAPTNFAEFLKQFEETGEVFMQSTGGTNFDPIFKHAEEQGFRKVLLITDGCAGLSDEMKNFAESIETYTVFTHNHDKEPLTEISKRTWVMPRLKIKAEQANSQLY